jgi:release factor glutamine methyltransferase
VIMKINELIKYGNKLLQQNDIEDASIISKILAGYILNLNKSELVIHENKEIEEIQKHRYYLALIEIIQGMPLQYITNNQEFYGLNFYVDENVLIPQPDTEILVEEVINIVKQKNNEKICILDMCTGSGCIGTAIAKNIQNANIVMADISEKALEIAKKNYENNIGKTDNAQFINTNMFEKIEGKFDIIVSNPPYIETKTINTLDKQVQNEPKIALDGGEDGLDFYKILINESYKYLNENGYLCMEIGYNQKNSVINLINESKKYKDVYCKKDLSGNDRVIIASKAV